MPMPPRINVFLTPGTGQPSVELTAYLSQESAPLLTSTIEDPTGTNNFTAADVSLKGYDPTGTIKGLFVGMMPSSTDYTVQIASAMWNDSTGSYSASDINFSGFVSPQTVQFNPKEKSFAFTVIGQARNLQTTSAAGLFLRTSQGYSDTKWTLQQDATPTEGLSPSVRVTAASNSSCDFYAGDVIQLGDNEQFTVTGVAPEAAASPAYWVLSIAEAPKKTYPAGAAVKLLTVYMRNQSLFSVARALFVAAGYAPDIRFGSAALPSSGALFATPVNMTGLPNGPVSGIAPFGITLVAGTPGGVYQAAGPTSPFSLLAPYKLAPVDPTNSLTTYVYTGPKRTRTRANAPRYGVNVTMKFFAYDAFQYGSTFNRYILTVTCNTDIPDTGASFNGYAFTTKLEWETYNTGADAWGGTTTLWAGVSNTTITDLSAAYDAIGIDVDPATGTCFFTDLDVSVAGGQININTSAYQPTGATIATGTLARNKATGVNGPTVFMGPGKLVVFQVDGILGKPPQALAYTTIANGTMTVFDAVSISPYVVGRSVKLNAGAGGYYGLVSDPVNGIYLQGWSNWFLDNGGVTIPPSLLFGRPPAPSQSASFGRTPYEVDLICLPTAGGAGSGTYPMVGLFGGTPYFISNQGSGLIPYVDLTGLSCADALQQLSVINAGIFYVTGSRNTGSFRSRATPFTGDTIGASDQIDGDAGLLWLTQQNVFNRWVGYVRVEHETDPAIWGEIGNTALAGTGQGLTLKTRFVSSKSFAVALSTSLYNYLGQQKRWIEVERIRDGRTYEVGRTFHCTVDGVNRNFQIIETGHPVCGVTVKVVGLEV
ncbi:MAG TPA: hypothetical protein VGM13_08670 [Thermoanaerobaculia bacterium]|jgi:hypothetical protein